jgi:hypothetical protein
MSEITALPDAPADKGLVARFSGVIFAPKDTFQAVVAKPRWIGIALIVVLVTAGAQLWFQSTEVGKQATFDESVRRVESFGIKLDDKAYEAMHTQMMSPSPARMAWTAGTMIVAPPIIWAAIAGLLFLVFAATGGQATFRQVYAVVVHSAVVGTLSVLLMTPMNYFRESMSSATNLAVFFPFLPEGSFVARLLGMVDVFTVWWVSVLAIGLAVCYRKKTRGVAIALFVVYGVIAVAVAAIMAMRSSS